MPREGFLWQAEAELFLCSKAFKITWGLHGPSVDQLSHVKRQVLAGNSSMMIIQYNSRRADKPGRPKVMAGAESFGPIAISNHVWFQCTDNNKPFSLSIHDTMFSHSKVVPKSKNRIVN